MIASTFMPTLISTVENYVYAIQRSALYILMNIILLAPLSFKYSCTFSRVIFNVGWRTRSKTLLFAASKPDPFECFHILDTALRAFSATRASSASLVTSRASSSRAALRCPGERCRDREGCRRQPQALERTGCLRAKGGRCLLVAVAVAGLR